MKRKKLSIVIPIFDEESIVRNVIEDVLMIFPDNEIIAVDDGSTDKTPHILKAYSDKIEIITLNRNCGYGFALKKGIEKSSTEYVGFMDADGQHSAKDLKKLWERHNDEVLVIGARSKDSFSYTFRRPGKYLLTKLAEYLTEQKIPDLNSGMRIIHKSTILKHSPALSDSFSFTTTTTVALLKDGYNVTFHPIKVTSRTGKSTVTIKTGFETIILLLRLIMLFDPLKIFLPVSFINGIVFLIWATNEFIQYKALGSTTIILFLSTILIFILGLLADQICVIRKYVERK